MKLKKSGDFIDLQLEMWRILWIFFPKIIWTMLLSPNKFHKMAKICQKKITGVKDCAIKFWLWTWNQFVCVCVWQWPEIWVCFLFSQNFAVQLSNHVIWVPWFLMILVELVRFFTLLFSVASQASYVAPTKSGPEQIMLEGRFPVWVRSPDKTPLDGVPKPEENP